MIDADRLRDRRIGWNGYDAPPPNEAAIRLAMRFDAWIVRNDFLPAIQYGASATGGVGLTFRRSLPGGRFIYVEFVNDGPMLATFSDRSAGPEAREIGIDEAEWWELAAEIAGYLESK